MEDESELNSSSGARELTFAEFADEICPYYLSIGVPYGEYWHGDYTQLAYYRKAYEISCDRANHDAWLQGAYIYDAICAVSPVLHAFAKRGTKPAPYLKEPYGVRRNTRENPNGSEAHTGAAKFSAYATQFNKKFQQKERH